MEKLLKLINEYEESRWTLIDDWLTEEEREIWIVNEEEPLWSEYEGHLWHCNANKVAFEKDTFDYRALSKKYWFIKRLCDNDLLEPNDLCERVILDQTKEWYEYEVYLQRINMKKEPIQYLISLLK